MARRPGGSSSTGLIALVIVFAILFIFALAGAILLYNQGQADKKKGEEAIGKLNKVASGQLLASPEIAERMQKASQNSVLGQVNEELTLLKQKVIGSPNMSVETIKAELDTLGLPPEQSLANELRRLRAEKASDDKLVDQYKNAAEQAQGSAKASEDAKAELAKTYQDQVTQLQKQVATVTQAHNAYQAKVDEQRKVIEAQLTEARKAAAATVAEVDKKVATLENEKADLRHRITELTKPEGRIKGPVVDSAAQVDGHIVSVQPESQLAYIDLGKPDHLLAGMTFEIYDKSTGVTQNEFKEWRGKGTLEVVSVGENSSVARIVRVARNKTIIEGDLIANVVYDRHMKFKFVVFGDFDIDAVGQSSTGDRRRVESMVNEWGGVTVSQLTYDVDFLVLGQEPKVPEALRRDVVDPEKIADFAARKKKYEEYQELVKTAKDLSIPILNQNRFLALVGYYKR